jgi:hypothetical protein
MITIENNSLVFRFPPVHAQAVLRIDFQRTLRIPDDNREYSLPPGLGSFPLQHVDDYAERVPASWKEHGGVFLPMYQAEALWINFSGGDYPFAVKIAAGKINAVTGSPWENKMSAEPQNYVVVPAQPWLDGFCIAKGKIRQFVAMPLGQGYTAEEQLTGAAAHGGIQVVAFPMRAALYEKLSAQKLRFMSDAAVCCKCLPSAEMGLAPGGVMRQEFYDDPHGINAWETGVSSRCFVHIANSAQYKAITGVAPPTKPPSAESYTKAGLPWFEYYAGDLRVLGGSVKLAGLDSVAALGIKKQEQPLPDNTPVDPKNIVKVGPNAHLVREGTF